MRYGRRRAAAFILAAVMLLSSCGEKKEYSGIALENFGAVEEALRTAMLNRSYQLRVNFSAQTLKKEDVEKIADELVKGAWYESGDPKGGDYLRFQCGGYQLRYTVEENGNGYDYALRIIPEYYTDAGQEAEADEAVNKIIEGFAFNEDASDIEKISAVYDYIKENVSYDTVHKHTPGSTHIQSTAYAALKYHTALCQGYTVLCYRLLKELGVGVRIITGKAVVSGEEERHAWNLVKAGDQYYNLDITLDDVNGSRDFFLKSDAEFAGDHIRDEEYMSEEFRREYPVYKESYDSFSD